MGGGPEGESLSSWVSVRSLSAVSLSGRVGGEPPSLPVTEKERAVRILL